MLHVNTEMPDMAVGLGTMLYAYMFVLEVYGDGHTDNSCVWSHIILQLNPSKKQASKQARAARLPLLYYHMPQKWVQDFLHCIN